MGARSVCTDTFHSATNVTSSDDHGGCFVDQNGVLHLPDPVPQWGEGARRQTNDAIMSTNTWIFLKNMLPGTGSRYSDQQLERLYAEASRRPVSTDYYLALSFKPLLVMLVDIESDHPDTNLARPLTKIEVRDLLLYGGQSWLSTDQTQQVDKLPPYTSFKEVKDLLKKWEAELVLLQGRRICSTLSMKLSAKWRRTVPQ